MSVNSLINSLSTSRVTGLYSGFDTDSIVENMMKIEQYKLNTDLRKKTTYQWKQAAYNGVSSDIKSFQNTWLTTLGSSAMLNSNVYTKFTVNNSNSAAVDVTTNSNAVAGTYTINEISQLAKAASVGSASALSSSDADGKGITGGEGNYVTLSDLKLATPLEFEDGKIAFSINGKEFEFSSSDTLQKVINTINSDTDAGVTMNYSRLTDKITITSKTTGEDSSVEITNIAGNAFGAGGAFGIAEGTVENGQDAVLKIEGIEVKRSSNKFTIDGITYNLKQTTGTTTVENGTSVTTYEPITFNIEKDVQTAIDKIKEFVNAYNELVKNLDAMIAEKKDSDYYPLVEEEESALTESQLKKWEENAKLGILYNDSGIRGMLDSLRSTLYQSVEAAGLTPADIGLTTGSWQNKGQISLDEDRLRTALENDSEQVMRVFMNISSAEDASTKYNESGFLYKVNSIMNTYVKETQANTLDGISRSLTNLNTKIDNMIDRMEEKSERLYKQYAAMETALSKLQSQSDSLVSMLSSSSK